MFLAMPFCLYIIMFAHDRNVQSNKPIWAPA